MIIQFFIIVDNTRKELRESLEKKTYNLNFPQNFIRNNTIYSKTCKDSHCKFFLRQKIDMQAESGNS